MKAVLLAAGFGTRLRPLTYTVPKCLVPIDGRPLLEQWLERLTTAGIGPFLVNTHYLADQVVNYVTASAYRDQVRLVHEPTLLGTGGTLLANRSFVGHAPVLLAHADNICVCDFREFLRSHEHRPPGCPITMMTFRTDTPESCGIVRLDARGVVVDFQEKSNSPVGNLANGAVYVLEPDVLEFMASLPPPKIDFSTEVLPHFVGRISTWNNTGVHLDIGTPDGLAAARRSLENVG